MNEFNLTFLAQYYNHLLGENDFDIKAFANNYVKDDKVKGTLQGTIYPIFAKGITALSSTLQITFEVPCDNDLQLQKYMTKIQALCGESRFNLDGTWTENPDGTGESGGYIYNCYAQLQLEAPLTAPQESNGVLVMIIQLTGAIRISMGENQPIIGYDGKTEISIDGTNYEEIGLISTGIKTVKEGSSDMSSTENTKIPYMIAQNTFYTVDFYYTGTETQKAIYKHIEKTDGNNDAEFYVYVKREVLAETFNHKCMLLSDSQIIETPSTYTHIILNLQTVD